MLADWFSDASREIQQGQELVQDLEAKLRHIDAVKWDSPAGVNFKRRVEAMHVRAWEALSSSRDASAEISGVIAEMSSWDQRLQDLQSVASQAYVESGTRLAQLVQTMANTGMSTPFYDGFNYLSVR